MGRPKALLPWRGRTLIAHMVALLHEVADEVVVVNSREIELPTLPARVVIDRTPALGPLGGIREGLHAIESELAHLDRQLLDPAVYADGLRCKQITNRRAELQRELEPIAAEWERRAAE